MNKPDFVLDIFLQPGDFYFGDRDTRIRTLLGSCVSITMWHPQLLVGGMCHYMLPGTRVSRRDKALDGRYADDVMHLFLEEIAKVGAKPAAFEVKMFGGGNQFPDRTANLNAISVPDRNIEAGHALLKQHGFILKATHLGGTGHRNLMFDVWSGYAWMKHVPVGSSG